VKHFTLVFFLLSFTFRPAFGVTDYSINIHVTETRMVRDNRSLAYHQNLIVTIDGKRCELESFDFPNTLLQLGNYKARLVKDQHFSGTYESYRVYELLLPDDKKRQFLLVGQWEGQ
jgi:hypothetical protein